MTFVGINEIHVMPLTFLHKAYWFRKK